MLSTCWHYQNRGCPILLVFCEGWEPRTSTDTIVPRHVAKLLSEFDVVAPDVADVLAAIDLHRLHDNNFWDALIVRSAKQARCSVLFSKDMPAAREIDGVRIVNPFR